MVSSCFKQGDPTQQFNGRRNMLAASKQEFEQKKNTCTYKDMKNKITLFAGFNVDLLIPYIQNHKQIRFL